MKNIILIGMPGSGKSTIGKIISKIGGRSFCDLDSVIEEVEGRKLQEIIDQSGNDYFHQVEHDVCMGFNQNNYVVATGGSAIYAEDAMRRFKERGDLIVYIYITSEIVKERITNLDSRGVTLEKGQTLDDLYCLRAPLYHKYADIIVECDGREPEEVAEEIEKICFVSFSKLDKQEDS